MGFEENINKIKEIFPGTFQIILDFASNEFLQYALREDYKYVWVYNHCVKNHYNWQTRSLPLFEEGDNFEVLSRHLKFDFVLPTSQFRYLIPQLENGIMLVQLNKVPTYYIDVNRMKSKTFYQQLKKECDYLFEISIPSARDYGTIVSCDKDYLESLLSDSRINWSNLP